MGQDLQAIEDHPIVEDGDFAIDLPAQDIEETRFIAENGSALFDPEPDGYERGTRSELASLLHGLPADGYWFGSKPGLDEYGISSRIRRTALIGHSERLPIGSISFYELDTQDARWFSHEYENDRWSNYDDEFTEDPHVLAQQTYDGDYHWYPGQENESALFSVFAEPSLDYLIADTLDPLNHGYSTVFSDHTTIPRLHGTDFSHWARESFQNYLTELSEAERESLGIDEPTQFDIKEHIATKNIGPGSGEDPFSDPVFREYVLFHHQGIRDFWLEYTDGVKTKRAEKSDREPVLYANQYIGKKLNHTPVATYYVSEGFDIVSIEQATFTVPPDSIRDIDFKIAQSAGRFSKPIYVWGRMNTALHPKEDLIVSDISMYRPTLLRIQFAEAAAHGAIIPMSLTGGNISAPDEVVNNWVQPDLSVAPELQSIAEFAWVHKPYLSSLDPDHRVAVVYSLPTQLWSNEPDWGVNRSTHPESVVAIGNTLREARFPYDIVTFGHEDLWTDSNQLDRLNDYDAVILPNIECISDTQLDAIDSSIGTGTTIIVVGNPPSRTENYHQRSDQRPLTGEENGIQHIEDDLTGAPDSPAATDFIDHVENAVTRRVDIDAESVGITIDSNADKGRTVVHVVNYDYDQSSDSVRTRTNIPVTIRGVDHGASDLRWYDDHEIRDIDFEEEDGQQVTAIPQLNEWGFLVIASSTDAFIEGGDRSAAETTIEEARTQVDDAASAGRTEGLAKSRSAIERAETAFEYERYALAETEIETALEALPRASTPPTIGIDAGHHSGGDPLEAFQEKFDQYEYRLIDEWSEETLSAVDILVFPPGEKGGPGYSVEVTTEDLEALDGYLQAGGNLILIGQPQFTAELNQLAEHVGFTYGDRMIRRDTDGDSYAFYVESPLSSLTAYIPLWRAKSGTTLRDIGDATVLGRITETEDPVYFNGDPDESPAGEPIMAGKKRGNGTVLAIAETSGFTKPQTLANVAGMGLIENIVPALTERAQQFRREMSDNVLFQQQPTEEESTE
ncbi:MAG: hypothetical protein ACOCY6_00990, partial [Halodesulfurarchaeum sp.]